MRRYPDTLKFRERKSAHQQKTGRRNKILLFVTRYHAAVPNLKKVLMNKWHLIQKQPFLSEIYRGPPVTSYKRGKIA